MLSELDRYLSSGPYGSSTHLATDVAAVYAGISDLLAHVLGMPVALEGDDPVSCVLRRATCERAFVAVREGRHEEARAFVARAARLTERARPAADYPPRPIDDWSSPGAQDIEAILASSMRADGFAGRIRFLEPSPDHLQRIDAAYRALDRLVPNTSRHTLGLLTCFALVEAEFESAYNSEAPLMFMMNEMMLADSLAAADTILHECLHQKMADLRVTSRFFSRPYDDRASEARGDLLLPWGRNAPRRFSVARGLATHHVYVHSAALFAAALLGVRSGTATLDVPAEEIERRFNRSMDRANFLGGALVQPHCHDQLDEFSNGLVAWLNDAVRWLDAQGLGRKPHRFADTGMQLV